MDLSQYFTNETERNMSILPRVIIELALCEAKEKGLTTQDASALICQTLEEYMADNDVGVLGPNLLFYKRQNKPQNE